MALFTLNTDRIDPYKNFKFVLFFEGNNNPIAGVCKVSPLKRSTEVVSHRDGGDNSTPRHSPGVSKFDPITLERGITFDTDFETWATRVYNTDGDRAVSLANYKQNLIIEVRNLQGIAVKSYRVFRAWASEYTALPELDSNSNVTMIESIVLQNEGWERDESVVEVEET